MLNWVNNICICGVCVCQTPPGLSPEASSIVHICVSFSYKYLALITDSGHVWMGTSNLKVSEIQQYHFNVFYGPDHNFSNLSKQMFFNQFISLSALTDMLTS